MFVPDDIDKGRLTVTKLGNRRLSFSLECACFH